eukprot:5235340-Prymnesium_polylepis.1
MGTIPSTRDPSTRTNQAKSEAAATATVLNHHDSFPPLGASLRGGLPTRHRGGRPGVQPPS